MFGREGAFFASSNLGIVHLSPVLVVVDALFARPDFGLGENYDDFYEVIGEQTSDEKKDRKNRQSE